jgi:putative membrane protein
MTRYQWFLAAAFAVVWVIAAINPLDRYNWFLENILTFAFVPVVVISGRYFRLSNVSYTLITLYLMLHVIGAHYTYGMVPAGEWFGELVGSSRNMFDRIVHFSFGFLLAYPIREVFIRVTGAKGVWGFFFPVDIVLSFSALYEIFEWVIAVNNTSLDAVAFLGTQGDVFDTQKDLAAAALGALIAMVAVFIINWKYNKKLGAEIRESVRIKRETPLGEVSFNNNHTPIA